MFGQGPLLQRAPLPVMHLRVICSDVVNLGKDCGLNGLKYGSQVPIFGLLPLFRLLYGVLSEGISTYNDGRAGLG
jgi:hypothetical protein